MFDLKSTSTLKAMREVFFFIFERKKRNIKNLGEKQTLRIPLFEFKKMRREVLCKILRIILLVKLEMCPDICLSKIVFYFYFYFLIQKKKQNNI